MLACKVAHPGQVVQEFSEFVMDAPSNGSCRGPLLLRCHKGAISHRLKKVVTRLSPESDASAGRFLRNCSALFSSAFLTLRPFYIRPNST